MGKDNGQRPPKPKGHNREPKPRNGPVPKPQTPQNKTTVQGYGKLKTPPSRTTTPGSAGSSQLSRALSTSSKSSASPKIDKSKTFDFLVLPGEVRNQIYELAFPPKEFHIQWLTKGKDLTYSIWRGGTWYRPHLNRDSVTARRRRFDYKRRSHEDNPPELILAPGPAALLLTCKQIHNEVITMFYGGSCFAFTSVKVLERFMETINPVAKFHIRKLYLRHGTYGEPRFGRDRIWKTEHDDRWEFASWKISETCPNLTDLEVRLHINDAPLKLNLTADWVQPLLCFCNRKLKKFDLTLTVRKGFGLDSTRLQNCAEVVKREILGDVYIRDVQRAEVPALKKVLPKARILRIISA